MKKIIKKEKDKLKICTIHGRTIFRHKENVKGQWFSCAKCLRNQWKKASEKRRLKKEVKIYMKDYQKQTLAIRKTVYIYFAMLLYVAKIKPE